MNRKIDFKLIALKPIKGCDEKYLKILTPDEFYYFYNNYTIDDKDHISFTETVPSDFFHRSEDLWVNISAIVGKNGSGKSTIIELLFMVLNNLAAYQPLTQKLIPVKQVYADVYFHSDRFYKIEARDEVRIFSYNRGKKKETPIQKFDLKNFFYTVIVNYSQHAYNDYGVKERENWIKKLFHKNDGYQTPIVLNPYRKNGNININSENYLVKSRLIANLLNADEKGHNFRQLTPRLLATTLKLTLNPVFRDKKIYGDESKDETTFKELKLNEKDALESLNNHFHFNLRSLKTESNRDAIDYILYKMVSIAIKYDDYEDFFLKNKKFNDARLDDFAKALFEDTSHVTFKLRQTINFLKYRHLDLVDQELDLVKFSEKINKLKTGQQNDPIFFVPPPVFQIEILLKNDLNNEKTIDFNTLSSGEKQLIYSASSLLYHLKNLDSIRNWKSRKAYRYVNVIMEEIELYFHPELQRNFIKTILDSIAKIRLKNIVGINICFVTHSPFILSDVPDCNIMYLNDTGTADKERLPARTFGGNIHELLGDAFFLGNGLIGSFAQTKLQAIIEQLDGKTSNNLQDGLGYSKADIFKTVNFVGEPFLRQVMLEKFYSRYNKERKIRELQAQINSLNEL
ncbi:AAA family ATPase [Mucilaginibacter sp.]|uniref:AAA family ATPase n=1 Tax=Mucilaginibacter sp. TaxID=1882438 RepID=UPI00262987EA|nr:AAA family ATPase [Mucilaginibacter sp.]MDB5129798.1 hypothetical protein [Mucilaginibacter sp.]